MIKSSIINYGFVDELDFLKYLYTPEQIQKMVKEVMPSFNSDEKNIIIIGTSNEENFKRTEGV